MNSNGPLHALTSVTFVLKLAIKISPHRPNLSHPLILTVTNNDDITQEETFDPFVEKE